VVARKNSRHSGGGDIGWKEGDWKFIGYGLQCIVTGGGRDVYHVVKKFDRRVYRRRFAWGITPKGKRGLIRRGLESTKRKFLDSDEGGTTLSYQSRGQPV